MLIRIREALVVAVLSSSRLLSGQARSLPPWDGGKTVSLGQPRSWKWTTGGGGGTALGGAAPRGGAANFVEGRLALQRDLWNPLISLAALQTEIYLRTARSGVDEGIRARLISPGLRVGAGVDYRRSDGSVALSVAVTNPIRRGGLFSYGGWLRFDYVPARDHTIVIGVEQPIFRRIPVGRTRPGRDYVPLSRSRALPAEPNYDSVLQRSIDPIREAADHIRRMSIPFLDQNAWRRANAEAGVLAELRELKTLFRPKALTDGSDSGPEATSGAFEMEVRRYHAAIEHAFALAAGGEESRGAVSNSLARAAAASLSLDAVGIPERPSMASSAPSRRASATPSLPVAIASTRAPRSLADQHLVGVGARHRSRLDAEDAGVAIAVDHGRPYRVGNGGSRDRGATAGRAGHCRGWHTPSPRQIPFPGRHCARE